MKVSSSNGNNICPLVDIALTLTVVTYSNHRTLADLLAQHEAGALSKKSLIELSPYSANADAEMEQIKKEQKEGAASA